MKTLGIYISALSLPMAFASFPLAAQSTDGDLDSTSSGQVDITLQVLDSVQISELNTIDFGTYGGADSGGLNSGDGFCVYVNGGDQYTITPTSVNSAFKLVGSTFGDEIEYSVSFNGAPITAYSTASSTFIGSNFLNCNATENASIILDIAETAMQAASTDTYSDTLILLVNPI